MNGQVTFPVCLDGVYMKTLNASGPYLSAVSGSQLWYLSGTRSVKVIFLCLCTLYKVCISDKAVLIS